MLELSAGEEEEHGLCLCSLSSQQHHRRRGSGLSPPHHRERPGGTCEEGELLPCSASAAASGWKEEGGSGSPCCCSCCALLLHDGFLRLPVDRLWRDYYCGRRDPPQRSSGVIAAGRGIATISRLLHRSLAACDGHQFGRTIINLFRNNFFLSFYFFRLILFRHMERDDDECHTRSWRLRCQQLVRVRAWCQPRGERRRPPCPRPQSVRVGPVFDCSLPCSSLAESPIHRARKRAPSLSSGLSYPQTRRCPFNAATAASFAPAYLLQALARMRQSDRASKADYEAEADLRLLLKQRLRRVLEQQPDSRKGRGQRWTSLLFPLYFLRWLANTILRRPVLSAVELSLREATQQSATLFPEPVRLHAGG